MQSCLPGVARRAKLGVGSTPTLGTIKL